MAARIVQVRSASIACIPFSVQNARTLSRPLLRRLSAAQRNARLTVTRSSPVRAMMHSFTRKGAQLDPMPRSTCQVHAPCALVVPDGNCALSSRPPEHATPKGGGYSRLRP